MIQIQTAATELFCAMNPDIVKQLQKAAQLVVCCVYKQHVFTAQHMCEHTYMQMQHSAAQVITCCV